MAKFTSAKEQVPEITELGIDPAHVAKLDALCTVYRQVQAQIAPLEETKKAVMDDRKNEQGEVIDFGIKSMAKMLNLPKRSLGETWDLRATVRDTSKINEDRLKMRLLQLGIKVVVECPPTQLSEDGKSVVACPRCGGVGKVVLESLDAVNRLVKEVTDSSQSVSWSVYGRDKSKEKK